MDLGTLLGVIAGLGVPIIGAILAVGKAFQKLAGLDEEVTELRETQEQFQARLLKTEEVRANVEGLSATLRAMSDLLGEKLNGLADKLSFHNESSAKRIDEMKRDTERRFDELNERLSEKRSFRSPDR